MSGNLRSTAVKGRLNNILMQLRKSVNISRLLVRNRIRITSFLDVSSTPISTTRRSNLKDYPHRKPMTNSSPQAPNYDFSNLCCPCSKRAGTGSFCSVRYCGLPLSVYQNSQASQFKLALNVIEDFLVGEGYKFLRLASCLMEWFLFPDSCSLLGW